MINYFCENWKYSNAPEGQQPFEKVVGLSKYGFAGSLVMGTYDSVLLSQTAGFWNTLNCLSYWVVPITAMCATYASVAYTSTKIRGKDDYANYVLASIATGGVCYQWQKDGRLAYHFTVVLIACSMIKKYTELSGWKALTLSPDVKPQANTSPLWDLTIIKNSRERRAWQ